MSSKVSEILRSLQGAGLVNITAESTQIRADPSGFEKARVGVREIAALCTSCRRAVACVRRRRRRGFDEALKKNVI